MAIIVITGDASATSLLADSLRSTAINGGRGALLVRGTEQDEAEVQHLLEKIIVADVFAVGTPAESINWKNDPQVILVNEGEAKLAEFEAACPGFTAKFGPVSRMSLA